MLLLKRSDRLSAPQYDTTRPGTASASCIQLKTPGQRKRKKDINPIVLQGNKEKTSPQNKSYQLFLRTSPQREVIPAFSEDRGLSFLKDED